MWCRAGNETQASDIGDLGLPPTSGEWNAVLLSAQSRGWCCVLLWLVQCPVFKGWWEFSSKQAWRGLGKRQRSRWLMMVGIASAGWGAPGLEAGCGSVQCCVSYAGKWSFRKCESRRWFSVQKWKNNVFLAAQPVSDWRKISRAACLTFSW